VSHSWTLEAEKREIANVPDSPSYEDLNDQLECSIENIRAIRDVKFIRANLVLKALNPVGSIRRYKTV
jgi:hypothetical protein